MVGVVGVVGGDGDIVRGGVRGRNGGICWRVILQKECSFGMGSCVKRSAKNGKLRNINQVIT